MRVYELLDAANQVKPLAATLTSDQKNHGLFCMAESLLAHTDEILEANEADLLAYGDGVMADRLRLTKERIQGMADGIKDVCNLPDPVGRVLETRTLYNGLQLEKVSVPIGVVAVIYESRPNVTSDAAALLIKSGNVCVLRGGKEAFRSSMAIVNALKEGLEKAGLPKDLINMPSNTERSEATALMTASGKVDLLIPRGGAGLIRACVENATVPCIETGTGICHIYVDDTADLKKAVDILENAKMSRPSVCNATEVCLVNEKIASVIAAIGVVAFMLVAGMTYSVVRAGVMMLLYLLAIILFPDIVLFIPKLFS
jgi:glutamate-5-semialdehyde dehydrogenase